MYSNWSSTYLHMYVRAHTHAHTHTHTHTHKHTHANTYSYIIYNEYYTLLEELCNLTTTLQYIQYYLSYKVAS